jgi:NAD(P)-dependent dehydrogenase (short-subunit alcohol dehydrogenase family)
MSTAISSEPKTVLITGASSGIGYALAKKFLQKNWQTIIVGFRQTDTDEAVKKLSLLYPKAAIKAHSADLSLAIERKVLTSEILSSYPRLDMLVNNAGAVYSQYELTTEGIEKTFALNHLGYFHLTMLLLPLLQKSPSGSILNITSRSHFEGSINYDYITGHRRTISSAELINQASTIKQKILFSVMGTHLMTAYSQSKIANVIFTKTLASKLAGTSIKINCVHPGMVRTNISTSLSNPFASLFWKFAMFANAISAEQSAEYILDALKQIDEHNLNGAYFEMNRIAEPKSSVYDENMQQLLWRKSLEWCAL